jgi:phospholipid/cholesterol/gamma-HCH transport system permease protein
MTKIFESIGDCILFGWRIFREGFRRPFELNELARQVVEIGSRSVPLVLSCGLALGVVMSVHTRTSMVRFGAASMIPAVMTIAFFRELGPLVTGLLVAGRVGAGIGAQVAGMRVTEQIDALESLAIDSFKYLVVTRVAACMIALPILTLIVDFAGVVGGLIAELAVSNVSAKLYIYRAFGAMDWSDYLPTTLKTVFFGLIIGTISSFLGYTAKNGAAGVGQASTQSVVLSSLTLILVNIILVQLTLFLFPGRPS